MPYSLNQIFHSRGSDVLSRDKANLKLLTRRQSTGTLLKSKSTGKSKSGINESPSSRKPSYTSPPAKKITSLSQRSNTLSALTVKASNHHKYRALANGAGPHPPKGLNSPDHKPKQAFYDLAWSIVTARRHRANSETVPTVARKNSVPDLFPSSPLVTVSSYRNLVHVSQTSMAHRQHNGVGANGASGDTAPVRDDDEYHPANVESLVRKCAERFDNTGECDNVDFLRAFFLSHLWFMTSEQLMILFTQLYQEEKATIEDRKKIFFAIRFWISEFPHMFDLDSKLVSSLEELQNLSANDVGVDSSLIGLSNRVSFKWMTEANMSVKPNQVNRKQRKVSLVFNHLEPEDIAIHISYLEYKSFRRLTLLDFHRYVVQGVIKNNVKLERAVFLFNNITQWVQCMILDHIKPQDRANAIVKFIEIAKKLYAMRNFNTLMAVVGALTHTAIARLKKTMAVVPKDSLKTLDEFIELLDSKSNYNSYRKAYGHVTEEFKIPIIGILMKDLIALHAALSDRIGDGLINVRKMMMIGGMFQELIRLQTTQFPYEINRDLLNTLRVSLYLYYNEDEVYQLSFAREPREAKPAVPEPVTPSPSKSINIGFAEFANFNCQMDEETIRLHVTAMVMSVYKGYDENSDGFISESEFENFIKNFPGIDSFATVDNDHDGKISLNEMIDYFMKISTTRRNQICQGFRHDFVETTYFQPTFCEECKKLLWGLVKQGWKCKGCAINCHKHCKDLIVHECRMKSNNKTAAVSSPVHKKRNKQRNKLISVSSESDFSTNGDGGRPNANDDDADTFTPGEYKIRPRSNNIKRPASFTAADADPSTLRLRERQNKPRASLDSPTKKLPSSTLNHEIGKSTLQRKMKIMRKKLSSKNILNLSSGSKMKHEDDLFQRESLLELDEPPTCIVAERRKADSNSEDADARDDGCFDPAPDPDPKSVTASKAYETSLTLSTDCNARQSSLSLDHDLQTLTERRDSGLSSCSCLTNTPVSTSAPVTPSNLDSSASESRFQYPSTSSPLKAKTVNKSCGTGLPDTVSTNAATQKSLLEENYCLRVENAQLREQVLRAKCVIQRLETRLESHSKHYV